MPVTGSDIRSSRDTAACPPGRSSGKTRIMGLYPFTAAVDASVRQEARLSPKAPFESIYTHGFLRLAIGTPRVALADPSTNARRTLDLAQRAVACKAALMIFPELGISGYTLEDLALQDAL